MGSSFHAGAGGVGGGAAGSSVDKYAKYPGATPSSSSSADAPGAGKVRVERRREADTLAALESAARVILDRVGEGTCSACFRERAMNNLLTPRC